MNIFAIVTHIEDVTTALNDIQSGIKDVVQGKATEADAEKIGVDLVKLITDGFIAIPGMNAGQVQEVITSFINAMKSLKL